MATERTAVQLYRDLLRMVRHSAGVHSPKSRELRNVVKREFLKNAKVEDEVKLSELKHNGVRALSNYLLMQAAQKDGRFGKQ
ncbi:hypothetical protein BASA81_002466 [Batrachochytrium salamandrivorans]|nr:hypothetical protein BASA81_002466 [Batrachochytrium salamandrivorans]